MTLMDRRAINLVAGYKKLMSLERELLSRLEQPLLKAYVQRQEKYRNAQKKYCRRRRQLPLIALVGVGLILMIFLSILFIWSSAVFVALGLSLFLLGVYLVYELLWAKPRPPQNPLHPSIRNRLLEPPLPAWRERLIGTLPSPTKHGDKELQDFVKLLQCTLDHSHLFLYEIQPKPGDDADLIVIGPTGIWLFEAKCWAGEVTWQQGRWYRQKEVYGPGGIPTIEHPPIGQPPDEQWQRMADKTKQILKLHAKEYLWTAPSPMNIKGGIVFTHPTATYNIASNFKFKGGDPAYWRQKLNDAPVIKEMTAYAILGAVEALLRRHQELNNGNLKTYCMSSHADELMQQVENKLKAWL